MLTDSSTKFLQWSGAAFKWKYCLFDRRKIIKDLVAVGKSTCCILKAVFTCLASFVFVHYCAVQIATNDFAQVAQPGPPPRGICQPEILGGCLNTAAVTK